MSDALPLVNQPSLEIYARLADQLHEACLSNTIREWAECLLDEIDTHQVSSSRAEWLEARWQQFRDSEGVRKCNRTVAQRFVSRCHGFASWDIFTGFLEELPRAASTVGQFEAAANAIVAGNEGGLRQMLQQSPELVKARSLREHQSTLLHYVSANGVEDFRQRTPPNIVSIARLLLETGADVNALSEAYGGGSTTLSLAATSIHPQQAGVQIELMELLMAAGATIGNDVVACLRNGRGEAAEYLAANGAPLDFEGAAGVGRMDLVTRLHDSSTSKQRVDGFAWACQFGRLNVVEFLLDRGIEIGLKLPHHGQTGLHWAAHGGHADTVALLLKRGARVDLRDDAYNGTPVDWALDGRDASTKEPPEVDYSQVIAMLAGAKLRGQSS